MFLFFIPHLFSTLLYSLPLAALPVAATFADRRLAVQLGFGYFLAAVIGSILRVLVRARNGASRQAFVRKTIDSAETAAGLLLTYLALVQPDVLAALDLPAHLWAYGLGAAEPASLLFEALAAALVVCMAGRLTRELTCMGDEEAQERYRLPLLFLATGTLAAASTYIYAFYSAHASSIAAGALAAACLTASVLLGGLRMGLGRGNVVELAALVGHTTLGIYFAQAATVNVTTAAAAAAASYVTGRQPWFRGLRDRLWKLPASLARSTAQALATPLISMAFPYATVAVELGKAYSFDLVAAMLYRLAILATAANLVQRLWRRDRRAFNHGSENQSVTAAGVISGATDFTRPLWLAVYTHSLLQNSGTTVAFDFVWWRWLSTCLTILLYALNLIFDQSDDSDDTFSNDTWLMDALDVGTHAHDD
ncbi:hypothetical protein IWQ60_002906 [Tieghemiomyces parasiticus]|uniref:Uncharacterized protein n=1 Tax=Tieghemiomyces parasiticus TaxID=78921 RepID=A0A9W8AIC8_9FUNG|nr:hypothetical protein IWQ60_002906 [Tieghemiomyces parasiticus]